MAYNVIKGNIEFSGPGQGTIEDMVDDHSDQTIAGTKTFSQMVTASSGLSASVLHGDGSNLTGITSPPIDTYNSSGDNRVLTSVDSTTVQGEANLLFNGSSLTVTGDVTASANVSASAFQGDGNALTNIGPSSLNLGNGLEDSSGLAVKLNTNSGLALAAGGLSIDANNLTSRVDPLAGTHTFPFYDTSTTRKATLSDISSFVENTLTIPSAQGSNTEIQFKNAGDFDASSNLTFNPSTNKLTTTNATITADLKIDGKTTTKSRFLNVSSSNANCTLGLSNEILMMINPQPATASLPSASSDSVGLTYTIKRTQAGEVEVSGAAGQTIDNSGATRKLTAAGEYIKLIATEVGVTYGWAIIGKSGSF